MSSSMNLNTIYVAITPNCTLSLKNPGILEPSSYKTVRCLTGFSTYNRSFKKKKTHKNWILTTNNLAETLPMSAKVTSCFHCSRQKLWHHPDPSSSSQIPYLTHQQIPSPPFLTHPEARSFACSALPLDDAQLLRELLSFPLTSFVSQLKWHLSREPFLVCPIQHDPRLLLYFSS